MFNHSAVCCEMLWLAISETRPHRNVHVRGWREFLKLDGHAAALEMNGIKNVVPSARTVKLESPNWIAGVLSIYCSRSTQWEWKAMQGQERNLVLLLKWFQVYRINTCYDQPSHVMRLSVPTVYRIVYEFSRHESRKCTTESTQNFITRARRN